VAFVLLAVARAVPCVAHGGPPLRIGATPEPAMSAAARIVLVHLRDGVGFGVDWREFPDEASRRAAFAAGKLDVVVAAVPAAAVPAPAGSGECSRESLARLTEALRRDWGAEAYLLGFATGPDPCARLALIVARPVLADLRFGILGKEAARAASFITREDLAAVQAAAARGGERAAVAAARAALAGKAKR
jgi:hypothetical protein